MGAIRELQQLAFAVAVDQVGFLGAPPFDAATTALARSVAEMTSQGALRSVAGGGDTVSALRHAGVLERLSYVSTAGGAIV